jgi:hypothetical protein
MRRRLQPTAVVPSEDVANGTNEQSTVKRVQLAQFEQGRPRRACAQGTNTTNAVVCEEKYSDEQLQEIVDTLLELESELSEALVGHR